LTFEDFTAKLAVIQSDYLSIDCTLDIKRDIVGRKALYDCTEKELDKIMNAYRWEYLRQKRHRGGSKNEKK